jgi:predicted TIM-barrel fold metal-dependent hydrolase
MVIDVHCHVGLSARRVELSVPRFSFEQDGAAGRPGYDSYFSPRLLKRAAWYFVKRWLKIDPSLPPGETLDVEIEASNERHWSNMPSVDRLVILAFDEYYEDGGRTPGPAATGASKGSDLYVSNSFVRAMCAARPERYLFGASIHPYRPGAIGMLEEVVKSGAVLVKWLPIHQNMNATDSRTVAFLRRAAELNIPMLIHYGGEMSLTKQHREQESVIPMLSVLRRLRAEGKMPTVIVAHAATPSFIWQDKEGHRALIDALVNEFSDAPLYADISALAALGRTHWLRTLARQREVHRKLVWGSDFPIPVLLRSFWLQVPRGRRTEIAGMVSWIEQDYQLKRALGFGDCVFTQAERILRLQ